MHTKSVHQWCASRLEWSITVCILLTFVALGCDYLEIDLRQLQSVKAKHEPVFMVFTSIYNFLRCSSRATAVQIRELTFDFTNFRPSIPFFSFPNRKKSSKLNTCIQNRIMYSILVFLASCHCVIGPGIYVMPDLLWLLTTVSHDENRLPSRRSFSKD